MSNQFSDEIEQLRANKTVRQMIPYYANLITADYRNWEEIQVVYSRKNCRRESLPLIQPHDVEKPDPEVEPKDEPKVEPKDEPKMEPKDEPKVKPKVPPKTKPKTAPQPQPKPQPKVAPKVPPKPEPKPEPSPEPTPQPNSEPTDAPKVKPKVAPKPKPKTEPMVEPKAEPIVEPKADLKVEQGPQPKPESMVEPQSVPPAERDKPKKRNRSTRITRPDQPLVPKVAIRCQKHCPPLPADRASSCNPDYATPVRRPCRFHSTQIKLGEQLIDVVSYTNSHS